MSMQVDFYIWKTGIFAAENYESSADKEKESYLLRLCSLIQKIYAKYPKIVVQCRDEDQKNRLDDLLWTFDPNSFLPHGTDKNATETTPIFLSQQLPDNRPMEVFINLKNYSPEVVQTLRMVEWVYPIASEIDLARNRYRQYQSKQYDLKSHLI
jgi:DNA polymerase-3 subunit chi